MLNTKTVVFRISLICFLFAFLSACTETSELDKLNKYIASINANEGGANGGVSTALLTSGTQSSVQLPPSGPATALIGGTPRQVKEGFCGDGIINGTTEDCDQGAIQNTSCRDYGGLDGTVRCQQNCLYDIRDCITPAVDQRIGGIAETCQCNCGSSPCSGGCGNSGAVGQATCQFICDQLCTCHCEGKLQASVERCKFRCLCTTDVSGTPACTCNLDDCQVLVAISPNIATLATAHPLAPH